MKTLLTILLTLSLLGPALACQSGSHPHGQPSAQAASGVVACNKCSGSGKCWPCGGTGIISNGDACSMCSGSARCYYCAGCGSV